MDGTHLQSPFFFPTSATKATQPSRLANGLAPCLACAVTAIPTHPQPPPYQRWIEPARHMARRTHIRRARPYRTSFTWVSPPYQRWIRRRQVATVTVRPLRGFQPMHAPASHGPRIWGCFGSRPQRTMLKCGKKNIFWRVIFSLSDCSRMTLYFVAITIFFVGITEYLVANQKITLPYFGLFHTGNKPNN